MKFLNNKNGFSGKELLITLGSILLLCLLAWPAFFKLKEWRQTKPEKEQVNAATGTGGPAEALHNE